MRLAEGITMVFGPGGAPDSGLEALPSNAAEEEAADLDPNHDGVQLLRRGLAFPMRTTTKRPYAQVLR